MNTTLKLTSRARNLGFGSTSDVEQTPRGLRVKDVTSPDVTGGLATIEREYDRVRRLFSGGCHWRAALFVGGRLVTADKTDLGLALAELCEFGETLVTVRG